MNAFFKQQFAYDYWAGRQILEKFEYQFPQNERIYRLFSHMLSAQRVWLDRCLGLPQSIAIWAERLPEEITRDTAAYHQDWLAFIEQLEPGDFDRMVSYTNSMGHAFETKLIDIIRQVTNHGTHHRGQILMMMKEEGFVLPNIDYITFVR